MTLPASLAFWSECVLVSQRTAAHLVAADFLYTKQTVRLNRLSCQHGMMNLRSVTTIPFFFKKKQQKNTTLRCSRQWSSVRALMNRGEFFFPHENLFASAPGQVRWTLWIFSTGKQPLKENWRCVRFVICGFLFWFSRIFLKNKKFH